MAVKRVFFVFGALLAALGALTTGANAGPPAGVNCPVFPADSFWHADVSRLPVHPRSAAWMANMGGSERRLHPDFGPSGEAQPYGIPYAVVPGSKARVTVDFEYADESDPGPYPFGTDTPIEGGSDRHALMIDRDACVLYELFAAEWNGGSPTAGSGAVFDLRSNALRPSTWTSADAAGFAIFPGLLRLDEVRSGRIDHPIRMTAQRTDRSFVWPARHQAGAANDPNLPPMGAWFRMKSSVDITRFRPETQVILRAFKTHGMILADNGSNWYFTGSADDGWDSDILDELKSIPAGAFEAVDASSLMVHPDSGQIRGAPAAQPSPSPSATPTTRPAPNSPNPRLRAHPERRSHRRRRLPRRQHQRQRRPQPRRPPRRNATTKRFLVPKTRISGFLAPRRPREGRRGGSRSLRYRLGLSPSSGGGERAAVIDEVDQDVVAKRVGRGEERAAVVHASHLFDEAP